MRARDAIIGSAQVQGGPGSPPTLDMAARFRRLDGDHQGAVIAGELFEDLSFEATQGNPADLTATSATILHRLPNADPRKADYAPLATITRPTVDQFRAAVTLVGGYADLREDRLSEILSQTTEIIAFFAAISPVEPSRSKNIREILSVGLDIATMCVMRVKLALGCPRPTQFSDRVQPMISCPSHAAYPSGHSTQAFTLATLLTLLDDPAAGVDPESQLYRMACRIAINRTVAGVHYPADSASGAILGIQIGRYLMARALNKEVTSATFDGSAFEVPHGPRDFHFAELQAMLAGDATTSFGAAQPVRVAPLWSSIWARASEEWGNRWS
ncbi:phosphatase PAP2 family protein (plasmid) [Paracoccus sp. TK19116]|uniref:Phosphatase PAP2 family protein n=1 Tax=Paracoccus albicereus TaxID=2922394 RepID=A0ABT1MM45_9RHOB|nr:phosphatase PAP2 family protein [Paracoccus albicereus]MCQ0969347.1 phosphatase PAP2 family protein [Paracoccus albicereus]